MSKNIPIIVLAISGFILAVYLDRVVLLLKDIFPWSSINGIATISDRILFITFLALFWYAWETQEMKKEMVYQSELHAMPFLAIYIRNIKNIDSEEKKEYIKNNFAITREIEKGIFPSEYYLVLRNMGKGTALDVRVESDSFIVQKYATKIIAPEKDEQPFRIVKKGIRGGEKIRKPEILNSEIFCVFCKNMEKIEYCFKYKILDLYKNEIEYLGYQKYDSNKNPTT